MIEILIVISIISLLASISLGAILIAREKTKNALAATFISTLSGQLEHYYQDMGRYPGAEFKDGENAFPALFEALFGERPPRGRGGDSAPYMELHREDVLVAGEDGAYRHAAFAEIEDPAVAKYIQDPWGNPYVYRENRSRPPRDYFVRRGKADLYCLGKDGIDQTIRREKGDDIGNW